MNVVYSSSDSYAPIAGVSICSLLKNNTDADEINIYMIDNNISAENKQRFENTYNSYHALGKNGVMDAKRDKILAMPEHKAYTRRRSSKKQTLLETK